jgi:hypothetical protein
MLSLSVDAPAGAVVASSPAAEVPNAEPSEGSDPIVVQCVALISGSPVVFKKQKSVAINASSPRASASEDVDTIHWFLERRNKYAILNQDVGNEQLHTLAAERGVPVDELRAVELEVRRLRNPGAASGAAAPTSRPHANTSIGLQTPAAPGSGGGSRRRENMSINAKAITFRDGHAVLQQHDDTPSATSNLMRSKYAVAELPSPREVIVRQFVQQQRRWLDDTRVQRSLKFSVPQRDDDTGAFTVLFNDDIGPPLKLARSYKQLVLFDARLRDEFTGKNEVPRLPTQRELKSLAPAEACQQVALWLNNVETMAYMRRRVAQALFLDTYVDDGWRSSSFVTPSDIADAWQWVADSPARAAMQDALLALHARTALAAAAASALEAPAADGDESASSEPVSPAASPMKRKHKQKKKRADDTADADNSAAAAAAVAVEPSPTTAVVVDELTAPIIVADDNFIVEGGRGGLPPVCVRRVCGNTANARRVVPCIEVSKTIAGAAKPAAETGNEEIDPNDAETVAQLLGAGGEEFELEQSELGDPIYAKHFYFNEHETWLVSSRVGKVESILTIASVPRNGTHRAILRTKKTDVRIEANIGTTPMSSKERARLTLTVAERLEQGGDDDAAADAAADASGGAMARHDPSSSAPSSPRRGTMRRNASKNAAADSPSMSVMGKKLRKVPNEQLGDALLDWDTKFVSKHFKFGVLRVLRGQVRDENTIYANNDADGAFGVFLSLLGETVRLKGHKRFRGGLDCKGDTTGTHSVFATHRSLEIMFHVGPLLPYFSADVQQVERKRHIGNDVVVIVFNESGEPFDPSTLTSHFNHVFCVVTPLAERDGERRRYRVAFASKLGVRPFGPFLANPAVWEHGSRFRDFLLTKLVNSERAAMFAPEFRGIALRTRGELLARITAALPDVSGSRKFASIRKVVGSGGGE